MQKHESGLYVPEDAILFDISKLGARVTVLFLAVFNLVVLFSGGTALFFVPCVARCSRAVPVPRGALDSLPKGQRPGSHYLICRHVGAL